MTRRIGWMLFGSLALCGASLVVGGTAAVASRAAACRLDVTTTQICPVAFTASAGKRSTVVVARYEDFTRCNFPAPASEPGENGAAKVAWLSIDWGDGTRATSGTAHIGTKCPGTSVTDSSGATEPITGTHTYAKPGTYTVTVYLKYVRGRGNHFVNCVRITPNDTAYDIHANCVALRAPALSTGHVRTG